MTPALMYIPETVTHQQFGAEKEVFKKEISGQFIRVIDYSDEMVHLQIAPGDQVYKHHVEEVINWQNNK
jgi:hypothetical protein